MTDFSKIGKSNRRRGASYERKIANFLTKGFGVKFKRSPRSGALLREGAINGIFISGDLTCELDFMFSIECKNCKDINIESILKKPNTAPIVKYWCQCVYDAKEASSKKKKFPLMFFNMKSIRKDFVCVCDNGIDQISSDGLLYMSIPSIKGPVKIEIDNKIVEMTDIPEMNIFIADEFIDRVNHKSVFYGEQNGL